MNELRFQKILGLNQFCPKEEYVCFLPWVGEFGWYLMNFVKRVHGYRHPKKIVCIKPGHECLFPTAHATFTDWVDIRKDHQKAGVNEYGSNEEVKEKIRALYGDSVRFLYPSETSWEEKKTLARFKFVPEPVGNHDFDVDIVITPRYRQIERTRNYPYWQKMVDLMNRHGWSVAACGKPDASFHLKGLKYRSWDYTDVDSDVELMLAAKCVVSQESGLAYLAMLCRRPLFVIDKCHREIADLHRDPKIYFRNQTVWANPQPLIPEVKKLLRTSR